MRLDNIKELNDLIREMEKRLDKVFNIVMALLIVLSVLAFVF